MVVRRTPTSALVAASLLAVALTAAGCGMEITEDRARTSSPGKADSLGSCEGLCGGQSIDCACDDDCVLRGDCCDDKELVCDGEAPDAGQPDAEPDSDAGVPDAGTDPAPTFEQVYDQVLSVRCAPIFSAQYTRISGPG